MFRKIGFSALFLFAALVSQAQDPHFSQFYANPLYLNPALTGSNIGPRYMLNYRNQWASLPGFTTYAASYDQYFSKISGGVGLQVLADQAGGNIFAQYKVSGSYAHFLKLNNTWSLRSGFRASYGQYQVNWSNWIFNDQLDAKLGLVRNTNEPIMTGSGLVNKNFADFGAGFMLFSKKYYGGAAFDHVTRPNVSVISGGNAELPFKLTIHGGANFKINKNSSTRKPDTYIAPNIIYMRQGAFQQLNVGAYVLRAPFTGGIWYRQAGGNGDAIILLGGIQTKNFRFGYSYDITTSRLRQAVTGAHEISVGFMLDPIKKRNVKKVEHIPCPNF